MRCRLGHFWYQGDGCSTTANDHHFFLIVVQLGWPELRMNPLTFEVGLAWKFGLMAIFITVVAAAQVQKSCFQNDRLITLFLTGRNGPTGFIR